MLAGNQPNHRVDFSFSVDNFSAIMYNEPEDQFKLRVERDRSDRKARLKEGRPAQDRRCWVRKAPSRMMTAIDQNDLRLVGKCLALGEDASLFLHYATGRGRLEIVDMLLMAGADVYKRPRYGEYWTPAGEARLPPIMSKRKKEEWIAFRNPPKKSHKTKTILAPLASELSAAAEPPPALTEPGTAPNSADDDGAARRQRSADARSQKAAVATMGDHGAPAKRESVAEQGTARDLTLPPL